MMKYYLIALFIFLTIVAQGQSNSWKYPAFKMGNQIDTYFGIQYADPFRELEDIKKPKTKKWFEAQKKFYSGIMNNLSGRLKIKADVEKYVNSGQSKSELPKATSKGIFYVTRKNSKQVILFRKDLNSSAIEIFSTLSLGKDAKKYTIDYFEPSYDGRYIAFGISFGGDEMSTLRILDVERKELLNDRIERTMYGNPQWLSDGSGFFYNQFKSIVTEEDKLTPFDNSKVFLHYIGQPKVKDKEIISAQLTSQLSLEPIDFPFIFINPTSQKAVLAIFHGSSTYLALYVADLRDLIQKSNATTKWSKITSIEDKTSDFALYGDTIFFISSKKNTYGALRWADVSLLTDSLVKHDLLEGKEEVLNNLLLTKKALYVKTLKNGSDILIEINPQNLKIKTVNIPNKGSVEIKSFAGVSSFYLHSDGLYLLNCNWNKDWAIYFYNSEKDELTQTNIYPQSPYSDASHLVIKEVEVPSYDGTLIPLTIVYSNKINLNGKNPTLLSGYGAYGISNSPSFQLSLLTWYENGGIFAVAHVRGGGEKGDAWYQGGFKSTKANSWKDFIACSEYLINNNYTSPQHLAASAESAGGITVGRAITERPDLFKAAYISYGAVNQMRDEFNNNSLGTTEFGSIKDSIEIQSLYDMDVYQHIKANKNYPSVLFTTAMHDPRVPFWQPAKAAARMQAESKGQNLILLRISQEGHWGEASLIDEVTDKYSFLFWQLGLPGFKLSVN